MATELAKAFIQIVPSAQGIKGSLSNIMEPEGTDAGNKSGQSLVSSIKKVIAAAGIGKVLSAAFTEGSALQQSLGGIETLYKDSADKMKAYAKEAYITSGVSANKYMENVTSFSAGLIKSLNGDTSKAAEVADRAMQDMSDNANKMGTNIQDIQNAYQGFAKQNYTMLDNLKLGYGGTKEEMQRLLKDAQKLSGQKYDISNLSDVYNAIHVIQDSLDITGTTANEAATTFSGSFGAMKAAAQDLLGNIAIGGDIKSAVKNLLDTTSTFIFSNAIPMGVNIVTGLATAIIGAIPQLYNAGITMLNKTLDGFVSAIPTALPKALQFVQQIGEQIAAAAPGMINEGFNLLNKLVDGIITAVPILIEYIPTIVTTFANIINDNAPTIIQKGVELIWHLVTGLIQAVPTLIANIPQIIQAIVSTLMAFQWLNIGKNIIKGIGSGIKNMVGFIKEVASTIVDGIKQVFSGSTNVGVQLVKGLWNGINSVKDWILDKVRGFGKGILDGLKDFFGIHSPSRLFEDEIGRFIPPGMALGIEASADSVYSVMDELSKNTLDIAKEGLSFDTTNVTTNNGMYSLLEIIIKLLKLLVNKDNDTVINLNDREVARALKELGVVFG